LRIFRLPFAVTVAPSLFRVWVAVMARGCYCRPDSQLLRRTLTKKKDTDPSLPACPKQCCPFCPIRLRNVYPNKQLPEECPEIKKTLALLKKRA
jgi:hypothetical protein